MCATAHLQLQVLTELRQAQLQGCRARLQLAPACQRSWLQPLVSGRPCDAGAPDAQISRCVGPRAFSGLRAIFSSTAWVGRLSAWRACSQAAHGQRLLLLQVRNARFQLCQAPWHNFASGRDLQEAPSTG